MNRWRLQPNGATILSKSFRSQLASSAGALDDIASGWTPQQNHSHRSTVLSDHFECAAR
jgi:hypothetical protein